MKRNTDYKNAALAALKGNWGKAVLATVIYMAIMYIAMGPYVYNTVKLQNYVRESLPQVSSSISFSTAIRQSMEASLSLAQDSEYIAMQSKTSGSMGLYYLLLFFIVLPLGVGFLNAFRKLLVQGDNELPGNMYKLATSNYWHKVWGMFLVMLFTFLWSLLFIIPGIIKGISYAMTQYILADCPNVKAKDALKLSMRMMDGHKWEYFVFGLSFIGWILLSVITLGLAAAFYTEPYMHSSTAQYYLEVRNEALRTGAITQGQLDGTELV